MQQKTILITNDDGIHARGIEPLAQALSAMGADVWVVAPDRERSAVSHAITLREPLRLTPVGHQRFACSGTPVDCAYIGIVHVCPRTPDLVISGMNNGYNVGTDIFYSGTVAAAVEGALRGVRSLAVSILRGADGEQLAQAASMAARVALMLLALPPARQTVVYNCNIPPQPGRIELTTPGKRHYHDEVLVRYDPKGEPYYWIGGPVSPDHHNLEGGEHAALDAGHVSLSVLGLSLAPDPDDVAPLAQLLRQEAP